MKNPALLTIVAVALGSLAFLPQSKAQGQGSSEVSLPHRFASGTPAVASQVNDNFDAIADGLNEAKTRVEAIEVEQTAQLAQITESEEALESLGAQVEANVNAATANANAIGELEERLRPSRTLVVAEENGDFTSIAEALESVSDASVENPLVVRVAPGLYVESSVLLVRAGVHLQGSGANTTTVEVERTGSFPDESAAAVRLFDLGRVSDITIVNKGVSATSVGILGFGLSEETVVADVTVRVDASGGSGHFAMHVSDSDLVIHDSKLVAAGASTVNAGLASLDTGGAFAQLRVEGSELRGVGFNSGIGAQVSSTAMTVTDSLIDGDQTAISATVAGINRLHHSRVETLGLNPAFTTNGSASVLSAGVEFVAGNPSGLASSFKYVHCYKANLNAVVNGTGSSVE